MSETSNPSGGVDTSVGSIPPDAPNTIINTMKFDGTNYLAWSQSALLYINDRDKEVYILEDLAIPSLKDPKYHKWKTDNATVMSWLLHSIKHEISRHYLLRQQNKSGTQLLKPTQR